MECLSFELDSTKVDGNNVENNKLNVEDDHSMSKDSARALVFQLKEPAELTEEQIAEIKDIFMLFDQNGDETITNNELGLCMRALGQFPTEAEMRAIIAEIDADGNGIIEFPEFVDLMSRRPWGQLGTHEELEGAIKGAFDHEGDGYLEVSEFRKLMTTLGEPVTDEQLTEMLQQFDTDGDGRVKYTDFVELIMQP